MINKKTIIYILIGILVIGFFVVLSISYDPQEEYENAINRIDYYRDLCESAGYTLEIEGHLKSPEEQKYDFDMSLSGVTLKCYEIKNDIKIYHNLRDFERIGGGLE